MKCILSEKDAKICKKYFITKNKGLQIVLKLVKKLQN